MEAIGLTVKNLILGIPEVVAIFGSNIWHMRVPQGQEISKYIRFYVYDVTPLDNKSGQAQVDAQVIRIELFAEDDESVSLGCKYIRDALDRLPHGVYSGSNLNGVQFIRAIATPDMPDLADRMYVIMEFQVRVIRERTQ